MTNSPKNKFSIHIIICIHLVFLEMLDLSFVNSTIVQIAHSFNVNTIKVDLLYISFSIGSAIVLPITSLLYNNLSVKSVLLSLAIALILTFGLSILTYSWWWFCILRLIQGIFLTLSYGLTYIYTIEFSENKKTDINLINGMSILGLLFGPIISGYISMYNWRYIFLILIFIMINYILLLFKCKFDCTKKDNYKLNLEFFLEYCLITFLLIGLSLIFENFISKFIKIIFLLSTIIVGYILYKRYYLQKYSLIFNARVFNHNFSKAIIFNFLVRIILSIIPLFSFILNSHYNISVFSLSTLLSYSALASLFAKFYYNKYHHILGIKQMTGLLACSMLAFCYLLLNKGQYLQYNYLCIIFLVYGFSASILYNICNLELYKNQSPELNNSLSLLLTTLQTISYGICVGFVFNLYNIFEKFSSVSVGLILTILTSLLLLILSNLTV